MIAAWTPRFRGLSLRFEPLPTLTTVLLALALVALAVWSAGLGSLALRPGALAGYLGFADSAPAGSERLVLDQFRLPRICLAMLCGAMLAVAGGTMQALTRNGLADPSLLGVREGAALCVIPLLLLAPATPVALRPVAGLAGGFAASLALMALARGASNLRFMMTGIGLSWFLSAVLVLILSSVDTRDLQLAMVWLAGNLQGADWRAVAVGTPLLGLGLGALLATARAAETARLGDPAAIGLGVALRRISAVRFVAAIALTAGAVSVAGSLAFVGLIAPHLARFLPSGGAINRLLVVALIGALLVLAADTIARRAFAPLELPTGIVLAALGAPLLLFLLWSRRNQL